MTTKAKRTPTSWGNIALTARTEPQRDRLKVVGLALKKRFNSKGISVSMRIPKSATMKRWRLLFDAGNNTTPEQLKDFDTIENGKIVIWSVPLSLFSEEAAQAITSLKGVVESMVARIDKDGNLQLNCSLKEEDVEAAKELLKESGLEIKNKEERGVQRVPGFIVVIRINGVDQKKVSKAKVSPGPKKKPQVKKVDRLAKALESVVQAYLEDRGLALYDKKTATSIPGGMLVIKPID